MEQEQQDGFFVTVAGKRVGVRPVSEMLIERACIKIEQEWRERGEPIDPPKYRVELAGGAEEWLEHDETTLKTDEDRAAWAAYRDARSRLASAQQEKKTYLWLMLGLAFDMPASDEWAEQQEALAGVTVPAEKQARRYWYIETELLASTEDLMTAISRISEASYRGVVSREALAATMKSLQSDLQGALPGGAGSTPAESEAGPVAVLAGSGTDTPGERMAHDARTARQARRRKSR